MKLHIEEIPWLIEMQQARSKSRIPNTSLQLKYSKQIKINKTMENSKIKDALQGIIFRLQDAEKGYEEIIAASSNSALNSWLQKYASERHNMHRVLEGYVAELGGSPEVDTTILGSIHRMFIDIKINNTSADNEFNAIVDEVERGSTMLIDEYNKVIGEVEMPAKYIATLVQQRDHIQAEVNSLTALKDDFNVVAV